MNSRTLLLGAAAATAALLAVAGCKQKAELPLPTGRVDALIPLPITVVVDSAAPPLQVPPAGFTWTVDDAWADRAEFWATWLPGPDAAEGGIPVVVRREVAGDGVENENEVENENGVGDVNANGPSQTQTQTQTQTETPDESYRLEVSGSGIELIAATADGVFRGLATLRQLLPVELEEQRGDGAVQAAARGFRVPRVRIEDAPRFPHRGILLDVCRHFQEPEFVMHTIDVLAQHKFNVLHFHLTEDQAWRIAIDAYPKLTEVGATRTAPDGTVHAGFYTKDELRAIVAYAAERHVTVIPEIELPGHSRAALAAYPWLGCTGDSLPVPTDWGVFKDIYCAGSDTTLAFLKTVLDEVIEIFPSRLIHIGGDEAPKVRWEECPRCQRRIRQEGLGDAHALQSWFISAVGEHLAARGRQIIGWDEILEGGLPDGATVQSWRGMGGGLAAVAAGRNAIMSPTSHCYFDYPLSAIDLATVYGFEPEPPGLDTLQLAPGVTAPGRILGGEGNLWSERIPQHLVESRLYPRALALAEVLWSPAPPLGLARDFDGFLARLDGHLLRLTAQRIDYGLEGDPVTAAFAPSATPGTLAVALAPAFPWVSGAAGFYLPGDSLPRSSGMLGDTLLVTGEGEVRAQVLHRNRLLDELTVFPVAGHAGLARPLTLLHTLDARYAASGPGALVDGRLGSNDFRDGAWQAVQGPDLGATVDLGTPRTLDSLAFGLYLYQDAWIFLPDRIDVELSVDGRAWRPFTLIPSPAPRAPDDRQTRIRTALPLPPNTTARYLRFTARNGGPCPTWHDAAGEATWLFVDEVVVY